MGENEEELFYELNLRKDLVPIIGYLKYSLKILRVPEDQDNLQNRIRASWNHATLGIYNFALVDLIGATITGNSLIVRLFE